MLGSRPLLSIVIWGRTQRTSARKGGGGRTNADRCGQGEGGPSHADVRKNIFYLFALFAGDKIIQIIIIIYGYFLNETVKQKSGAMHLAFMD